MKKNMKILWNNSDELRKKLCKPKSFRKTNKNVY